MFLLPDFFLYFMAFFTPYIKNNHYLCTRKLIILLNKLLKRMKKLFTLAILTLLTTVSASAQSTLRKTWDFREGFSAQTVNALKADQEEFGDSKYWRNYESDAAKSDEQHFWNASKDAKNSDGFACTHNGGQEKVIPELDGLVLGMSNAKKFVITYDGATSPNEFESEGGPAIGEPIPHGNSYIWLNGKNETIKFKAEVNQTIKIGVESHAVNRTSVGQARGISLSASVGSLELVSGNPVPTYYTECEWNLTGDAGAVAELTLKSTNGCHIYYIIVGDGDDPNANKTKVAYITNGDATTETAYQALAADELLAVTTVDASTVTAETLKANIVTVVSPSLPADNPAVAVLKEALAFTPILNLNADTYAAWGYGVAVAAEPIAVIKNLKSSIFSGFVENEDYIVTEDMPCLTFNAAKATAVTFNENSYFAKDDTLACNYDESNVMIHTHNLYHNAYIYIPQEAVQNAKLLANVIDVLKASKTEITQAPAPKIKLEYKDLKTNISMAMASSALPKPHIYYTLDGSDPTAESTEYVEPLTVTSETVVKAVAIAEGYLLSEVATATAEIFSQPAQPTIAATYNDGATSVTLACATEGTTIWYNYSESNDTVKSMKYSEPISLKTPATLTAFAVVNGQVFSELTTQRVVVKNALVRQDQIGHFDANTDEWGINASGSTGSTVYHFSWGKNARSIYDTAAEPIGTQEDPETGDVTNIYPEFDYEYWIPSENCEWELKSKGQVLVYQTLSAGMDVGNDAGYNPETTGDIIDYAPITKQDIQFAGKVSGEPYTASIQSRKKFQGPFNLVTYVGTASGGSNVGKMMLQVSTDSLNWTNVGDTLTTSIVKRLWKGYERSYNDADEVYVRITQVGGGSSIQIYDIYVLNTGEKSLELKKQYDDEWQAFVDGIETVNYQSNKAMKAIYNLNGIRQNGLQRGLNIVVMGDGSVRKVIK